jgi:hypothetical protein
VNFRSAPFRNLKVTSRSAAPSIALRGRLGIGKGASVAAGEQRATEDGVTVGLAYLPREIVHVRIEPHLEQDRGIDLSRFRIGRCTIQDAGQIGKKRHKHTDR